MDDSQTHEYVVGQAVEGAVPDLVIPDPYLIINVCCVPAGY